MKLPSPRVAVFSAVVEFLLSVVAAVVFGSGSFVLVGLAIAALILSTLILTVDWEEF